MDKDTNLENLSQEEIDKLYIDEVLKFDNEFIAEAVCEYFTAMDYATK